MCYCSKALATLDLTLRVLREAMAPGSAARNNNEQPEDRALQPPRRRLGRPQICGLALAQGKSARRRRAHPAGAEPAGRLRLPRLRLAGPRSRINLRILRKRRQGGSGGSHFQTRHCRFFCQEQRQRAAAAIGLRTGRTRPPDRAHGVRRRQRQIPADLVAGRIQPDVGSPEHAGRSEPGVVLYFRPHQQ